MSLNIKKVFPLLTHYFQPTKHTHIVLLSGKCPDSNPGGVGLHHSIHTANMRWGDAKTCADASNSAV